MAEIFVANIKLVSIMIYLLTSIYSLIYPTFLSTYYEL